MFAWTLVIIRSSMALEKLLVASDVTSAPLAALRAEARRRETLMNLEVCHLKKHYAGADRVGGFSLTLPSEGVTALCGPSGCGKTTLMRLIAGLETADAGTINGLDGAKISMVFQEDRLLPWCTAEQNIAIAAPGTEAAFWMEQSGIADARQKLPDELSGGMRRRGCHRPCVGLRRRLCFCWMSPLKRSTTPPRA
ncbi:MAG: ATP-binding cassette domain-containing protein [Eisenbergiella sp.]